MSEWQGSWPIETVTLSPIETVTLSRSSGHWALTDNDQLNNSDMLHYITLKLFKVA